MTGDSRSQPSTTQVKPLTETMLIALRNLASGEMMHGVHAIPGSSGVSRNTPLRILKERGLIRLIRDPYRTGDSKRVQWIITDAGRAALNGEARNE